MRSWLAVSVRALEDEGHWGQERDRVKVVILGAMERAALPVCSSCPDLLARLLACPAQMPGDIVSKQLKPTFCRRLKRNNADKVKDKREGVVWESTLGHGGEV